MKTKEKEDKTTRERNYTLTLTFSFIRMYEILRHENDILCAKNINYTNPSQVLFSLAVLLRFGLFHQSGINNFIDTILLFFFLLQCKSQNVSMSNIYLV